MSTHMSSQWRDRVALVTGGSLGIGRATSMAFARLGARVVIADVQVDAGKAVTAEIEQNGGEVIFIETDVSRPDQVRSLIDTIVDSYGRLDFAFNNAGIEGEVAPTTECTEENWDRVTHINMKGVWLCMKHEIRQMLEQGKGAIVNMSSVAGLVGYENVPAYSASKHGIIGLTKTAALEYADDGIRVNAICPGVIDTAMVDRFTGGDEEVRQGLVESQAMSRLGKPQEIADVVTWLCSDAASFVTGQALAADGGFVAR
jgi:NAD(P)-dependent dehydrogenase (short-subunit alcohol dehydrogenase family)